MHGIILSLKETPQKLGIVLCLTYYLILEIRSMTLKNDFRIDFS